MKHNLKISIAITSSFIFLCTMQVVLAENFSPLGKLAQDYIQRLNEDLLETNSVIPSSKQNTVVVNPEGVARDAVSESIDTISKTTEEMEQEKDRVIRDIKELVKKDIDTSITEIKKKIDKPAYDLQGLIDSERTTLFENVRQVIENITTVEDSKISSSTIPFRTISKKIETLKSEIGSSLEKIKKSLEVESEISLDFDTSKEGVGDILTMFEKNFVEKKKIIESRQGNLIFKDSDSDGISDYDEVYIYKTDQYKAQTKGNILTDGEKIQADINPLSDSEEKIVYQDPRDDKKSFVSDSYRVNKIQLIKDSGEKLIFEGTALPNTYLTLYIYSTSIILHSKTNSDGSWSYTLEKELDTGEHQMYIASVDAFGKIIIRSSPILFTKTNQSVSIGIEGSLDDSTKYHGFLKDNFILLSIAFLIILAISGMMFFGDHKNIKTAIEELKNHVTKR